MLYLIPIERMDCPPGSIYKLKKATYGLKQAGRSWFTILTEFLILQGVIQCVSNPCVFTMHNNREILIIVYVDDVIISTLKKESREGLIREIEKNYLQSRRY
jgi:hypothetical protein